MPDGRQSKHYETSERRPPLQIYSRTWEDTPNTLIVAEERRDLGWSGVGSVEVSLGPIDARGVFAAEEIAEWSNTQYRANGDRIRVDRRLVAEETDDDYRIRLEKRREQVLGTGREEHGWQTEDSWSWELPTLVTDGGQSAEGGRAINRRRFLAGIGATTTAVLAGCSNRATTAETTSTTTATETTNTTVTELDTTTFRLKISGGTLSFDPLLVGDELGGRQAEKGHKWVLAPVFVGTDQTDDQAVTMPALDVWRLSGYLGDETTKPAALAYDSTPQYRLGDTDVRPYPVDGSPDGVNDDETMVYPKFGVAFHAPENSGYELQMVGTEGEPVLSMVGKPPEGNDG